jgi:hypothetical protein
MVVSAWTGSLDRSLTCSPGALPDLQQLLDFIQVLGVTPGDPGPGIGPRRVVDFGLLLQVLQGMDMSNVGSLF